MPMKLLTSLTHLGGTIFLKTCTLSGSALMPLSLMMKPKYCVSFYKNLHLDSFNFN